MLPFSILLNIIINLLAICLLSLNYYFFYKWYQMEFSLAFSTVAVVSVILTILNFTGWIFVPLLLSKILGENITPEKMRQNSNYEELFVEKYEAKNSQITLVFTHGWSTTSQIWYYFIKAFENKYNLVFWDEPGLGKSKQPDNDDYSLTKYSTDLKHIVSQISPDQKIILIGHSIGGMIIQQLYKEYPSFAKQHIYAVALFNTTYTNPIKTALFGNFIIHLEKFFIKPLLYIQAYTWPIWQINNFFSFLNGSLCMAGYISGFRGNQSKNELNFTTRLMLISRVDTVAKGTLGMLKLNTINILKDIQVPTLIIAGQNDIMTKASASETIANNIPNSTLHIVKNTGHMGILEQSDMYINYLNNFVSTL
jgi:pimeloyl-ACP methyl ester carboxylesterase